RKDDEGRFLWPGYGENMRVLHWIIERVRGEAGTVESPLGRTPRYEDMLWSGLEFSKDSFLRLMEVERSEMLAEAEDLKKFLAKFGDRLPEELARERDRLAERAAESPARWKPEA
ncbi:MAG: phosphoenolpyruvate carboxykinase (GTP), partial [Planctomycetes bacterium]|nr:phosphoenolpyruvate carboxykinase (GTP) [Planctomycetota bacterium]